MKSVVAHESLCGYLLYVTADIKECNVAENVFLETTCAKIGFEKKCVDGSVGESAIFNGDDAAWNDYR